MKVVIPGGSGQVGTVLARTFHGDGHDARHLPAVGDGADHNTSTGKLMEGVLAAFAQFDDDVRD